uniref:Uncharacterized protein n=1 Tax=Capitella teleta TaxID=283909 RepID=X1ZDB3_CAPTE
MAKCRDIIEVDTGTDHFTLEGRPCELSEHSFVPKKRDLPPERTFFNTEKKERFSSSVFDRIFHQDYGYNQKLHRCDRSHAKSMGLLVNDEEMTKEVPSLGSTVYGFRLQQKGEIDPPDRKHVRIAQVRTEFYRPRTFNIRPPEQEAEVSPLK